VPFRAIAVIIRVVVGLLGAAAAQVRLVIAIIRSLVSPLSSARASFSGFGSAASAAARTALAIFSGLPGRIRSAIGSLASLLYQAGRNVVNGLINGIKDRVGALASTAANLAGTIRGYLPFSPAKVGPLSGRGNPYYSGQSIVKLVALGVNRNLRFARQASSALAEQFSVSNNLGTLQRAAAAGALRGFGVAAAAPVGPVYVSAQFGEGPVYDLVEGTMTARPQAVARAAQLGGTQLARR
jgi:hypothetical protein